MTAIETLQQCRKLGIRLAIRDGSVVWTAPDEQVPVELRLRIAEHSPVFLRLLSDPPASDWATDGEPDVSLLSYAERSLWLIARSDPANPAFNVCFDLTIEAA